MPLQFSRKYNETCTIDFPLFDSSGFFKRDASFAIGDVKIMRDGSTSTDTTNVPVDAGFGYSLVLENTELTAKRIGLFIIDHDATTWRDEYIGIETYGNTDAMHAFNLDYDFSANTETLKFKQLHVVNDTTAGDQSSARSAVFIKSNAGTGIYTQGTDAGLSACGDTSGHGIHLLGGPSTGHGLYILSRAGNSEGVNIVGNGSGSGTLIQGGETGSGLTVTAGTSGTGIGLIIQGQSDGIYAYSQDGGNGLYLQGDGAGRGLYAVGGSTGEAATFEGGDSTDISARELTNLIHLNSTIDSVSVSTILEYVMCMVNGKFIKDTSGQITFYKRDNTTSLFIVDVSSTERNRV